MFIYVSKLLGLNVISEFLVDDLFAIYLWLSLLFDVFMLKMELIYNIIKFVIFF